MGDRRSVALTLFHSALHFLLIFTALSTVPSLADSNVPGDVLSAYGTATVDGVMSPGEWNSAAVVNFDFVSTFEVHPSTLYVMNDDSYLYIGLLIRDEDYKGSLFGVQGDILTLFFDNDHDGQIAFSNSEQGDDFVQLTPGLPSFFLDGFRCLPPLCPYPTYGRDIDFGGTTDAIGVVSHTNPIPGGIGNYTFEIAKKLDSGDFEHDFSLAAGQMLGLFLDFVDTPIELNAGQAALWPGPNECVNFLTNGVPCVGADIEIAGITNVTIDIKPGSSRNSVNVRSRGIIPVAILSTDTFDADAVDPSTVLFGPAGAKAEYHATKDVDHDGRSDMVLHFAVQGAAIGCMESAASLTGRTLSGEIIKGKDFITTVGCK